MVIEFLIAGSENDFEAGQDEEACARVEHTSSPIQACSARHPPARSAFYEFDELVLSASVCRRSARAASVRCNTEERF